MSDVRGGRWDVNGLVTECVSSNSSIHLVSSCKITEEVEVELVCLGSCSR